MFGISSNEPDVHWGIHFGPTTNNAFAQARTRTFAEHNTIATAVPVFGLELLLFIENRGSRNETIDGKVYFVRDLP
jgi:hypothetical protein